MWVGIREMGRLILPRWLGLAAGGGVAGALWLVGFRLQVRAGLRRRERRMEEELAAYAQLDMMLGEEGNEAELAKRVSQMMALQSAFPRAAMLIRDAEGRLIVAASAEMDDSMVRALNTWGGEFGAAGRRGGVGGRRGEGGVGARVAARSFAVVLDSVQDEERGCRSVVVMPLWTAGGSMLGALVVGAQRLLDVPRSALAKALEPLEALAFKVERALENASLAERLLRAEKLAGLGLLAGGLIHALNDPLTAVLGFAELIVATTGEERVKEDAGIIVREALRMRQTLETLLEFQRPAAQSEELVNVTALARELAAACAEKLANRGVRLVVQAGEEASTVRGNGDRLRQMMEHLLNNAAQALAGVTKGREEQVIRVSVSAYGGKVHVTVSDTGPGFRDAGRAFELFDSMGLGLSVCYGIVHEHGGEISAFNLHPHGAAVAVELPVAEFANKKNWGMEGERTRSVSV